MLPAPDLASIAARQEYLREQGDAGDLEHLISIVFASPDSAVFSDLKQNNVYFDERTGTAWDLFFAGYYMYAGSDYDPDGFAIPTNSDPYYGPYQEWWFSPRAFNELRSEIGRAHSEALRDQGATSVSAWQYSGVAELVSFWAYNGVTDWASLRATKLTDSTGSYLEGRSLSEVVEAHAGWQELEVLDSFLDFEPGRVQVHDSSESVGALRRALVWTANQSGSAAIGLGVTKLLEHVIG